MAKQLQGLRHRVWESGKPADPRDVAESMRDIDSQLRAITLMRTVKTKLTYNFPQPLYLSCDHLPDGVLLVNAREESNPVATFAVGSIVQFDWSSSNQLRFTYIDGLTIGVTYNLTFLVIG